jgi:hypothetical protein
MLQRYNTQGRTFLKNVYQSKILVTSLFSKDVSKRIYLSCSWHIRPPTISIPIDAVPLSNHNTTSCNHVSNRAWETENPVPFLIGCGLDRKYRISIILDDWATDSTTCSSEYFNWGICNSTCTVEPGSFAVRNSLTFVTVHSIPLHSKVMSRGTVDLFQG